MSSNFPNLPTIQQDGSSIAKANTINLISPGLTASETSPGVFDLTASSSGGSVTTVSVTPSDGISSNVINPTTTPNIQLGLGDITPDSVVAIGTVSGSNLSGTNTGDQTITLTGDITGSGTSSFSTTISNNSVTYPKIQQASAVSVIGNPTNSLANSTAIPISNNSVLGNNSGTLQSFTAGSGITISSGTISSSGAANAITALTGDVTATGPGSVASTIANNAVTTTKINNSAVTYAKIQNESASTLLGNSTGSPASPSELTLNSTLEFSGTTIRRAALTGDVTASAGSNSLTIASNAVTVAKMQQVAANTVLCNPTNATANLQALALAASTLLGRDNTSNLAGITIGSGLQLLTGVLSSTVSGGFTSASTNLQVFTANGTFTRSANTKFALVVCVAAGGGSGGFSGGAAGTSGASGGGGSGCVNWGFYSAAAIGATAAIIIGAGGTAGASGGGNGGIGGSTSFGALVSAGGGNGGTGAVASASFQSVNGGAGGSGGGAQISFIGNRGGNGLSFGVNGAATGGYGAPNPLMGGGVQVSGTPQANTGAGAGGITGTTISSVGIAGASGYCYVYEFIFS